MAKYVQGAAFYLFIYLMMGLTNGGILYFLSRFLHVYPLISLGIIFILTIFILYFGFVKSIEIFFQLKPEKGRLVLGWMVQFISFLILATLFEKKMAEFILNPKLFKVLTVFVNFTLFFLTYWISVRTVVLRGSFEAG